MSILDSLLPMFGLQWSQVTKAYALSNSTLSTAFETQWKVLYTRFRDDPQHHRRTDWQNSQGAAQKFRFWYRFLQNALQHPWNTGNLVLASLLLLAIITNEAEEKELILTTLRFFQPFVVPMIHGTSQEACDQICRNGFAPLGVLDPGYYGTGAYTFFLFISTPLLVTQNTN